MKKKRCLTCGKRFDAPMKEINRGNGKYCCVGCAGIAGREVSIGNKNSQRILVRCGYCKKKVKITPSRFRAMKTRKYGLFFCSRLCKDTAQQVESGILKISHYRDGVVSYRIRAFRKYGKRCCKCGYDEYEEMLDVNHKDHNRNNGKLTNLEVLCVWCHAFETRILNRGKLRSKTKYRMRIVA
jgi:hypothetical protein